MGEMTQDEARRQAHYEKMTQTPVPKLVTTLAIPTIISMMVSAIYNMADTFFVSQLGTSAVGAVGIVFSLMAIIQAIGFTLGMGSGTIVSLHLGAKEEEKATCAASTGFFSAIVLGLALTVFGSLFVEPLMQVLGATETILPYARDYGQYICWQRRLCALPL
ncbi:MAG: MATE family efflux transporter [Eisenbergiella massiliensis]